jgi:hypothetical protein
MGCSCTNCSNENQDHAQKIGELLGSVGLKEIVDQGREAIAEAGRALGQLNRSERAKALGFGSEVIEIYSDSAKRSNQRAREQVQTVLDRLVHQTKQKGWESNVVRVKQAFKDRGGSAKLADLRADIRLRLLNDDSGLSATVAVTCSQT